MGVPKKCGKQDNTSFCAQYGEPMFVKSNSFALNCEDCIAYSGEHQLNEITDIRWSLFRNGNNLVYVGEDIDELISNPTDVYCDIDFGGASVIGAEYWLIIEVWNRYASYYDGENFHYNSEIINYSGNDRIYSNNHLINPYYDKYYYNIVPAGGWSYLGTKYLCGYHFKNRTYRKNKIFAAGHNGCTYTVESDNNIKFYGINEVTMREGFTAKEGSDFVATLDCGYVLSSSHMWNYLARESTQLIEIETYPNPTKGIINVSIDGELNPEEYIYYEIFDSKGALVKFEKIFFINHFQIDIGFLKPSEYVINIQCGNTIYSDIIIKQ